MAYLGRDEWDYNPRRPSPRRAHRSSFLLNPDALYDDGGGLSRTRSVGGRPNPIINVYNDVYQDAGRGDVQAIPGAFPAAGPSYPADREYQRGRRLNDELADELVALRLERERSRHRSNSHTHSPGHGSSPHGHGDYYRYEIEKLEREKAWRMEQERIKAEAEVQHLKEDAKRRQHEIDEHAERKRILAEYEKKRRDEDTREKELENRYREKIEREKREAKEKEEEQYRKFLLKQKEEKEKKDKEEKEEKQKIEDAMRKRLVERGFSASQIENIVNDEKKKTTTTTTTTSSMTIFNKQTPVFAKIHRDYLSERTLEYYEIPYKIDDHDSDYFIILREMDKHETNVLFEHTKALRAGRLLIDAPKKEKEYAFVRKRERSKSRRRSGEWRNFGIIEIKK